MSILPILGPGVLVEAAGATRSALAAVSESFAAMLGSASASEETSRAGEADRGSAAARSQVRDRLDRLLSTFRGCLLGLCQRHGVDPDETLQLQGDGLGGLRVTGTHSQGRRLEALIASQPELTDLFAAIESDARKLRGTDDENAVFCVSLVDGRLETSFVASS